MRYINDLIELLLTNQFEFNLFWFLFNLCLFRFSFHLWNSFKSSEAKSSNARKKSSGTSKKKLSKMILHNPEDISLLSREWSHAIPVGSLIQSEGVASVQLSEEALKHVFGLTVTQKSNSDGTSFDSISSTGFHHDSVDSISGEGALNRCLVRMRSQDKYVLEGFISYQRNEQPKFKTMFKSHLERSFVLRAWAESLSDTNCISVKRQPNRRLKIRGVSPSCGGIKIITIVESPTGQTVTFFPKSRVGRKAQQPESDVLSALFFKHFGNLNCLPLRQPVTEGELELLATKYSRMGIKDWNIAVVDDYTAELYEVLWKLKGMSEHRQGRTSAILSSQLLRQLNGDAHLVEIQKSIPPISLPLSTLRKVFANAETEAVFAKYLQRDEILQNLKEALTNYVTISSIPGCPPYSSAPTYGVVFLGDRQYRMRIALPSFDREHNGSISFTCTSNNQWTFRVTLNPETGCIENFFPLCV